MDDKKNREDIDIIEFSFLLISFFKRRALIIIVFIFLGGITGVVKYFYINLNKTYNSYIIVTSSIITPNIITDYVNSIQGKLNEKQFDKLSNEFNIQSVYLKGIHKIDTINLGENRLKINFYLTESISIDSIANGLIYYIKNKNFVKNKSLLFKAQNRQLVNLIDNKIIELDALKKVPFTLVKNKVGATEFEGIVLLHKEIINLMERKIILEKQYKDFQELEIIEKYKNEVFLLDLKTDTLIATLILVFVFFILGILTALCVELSQKIKKYMLEKQAETS